MVQQKTKKKEKDDLLQKSEIPLDGKKTNASSALSPVIYIGHLPLLFEEEELVTFLRQFGYFRNLRLSRSMKTGRSRCYAFCQFKDLETARIVAEAINGYLIDGKRLVSRVLSKTELHPTMFVKFKPREKVVRSYPKSKEKIKQITKKLVGREKKRREKLKAMGVDYDFPGYEASRETMEALQSQKEDSQSAKKGEQSNEEQKKAIVKTRKRSLSLDAGTEKEKKSIRRKRALSLDATSDDAEKPDLGQEASSDKKKKKKEKKKRKDSDASDSKRKPSSPPEPDKPKRKESDAGDVSDSSPKKQKTKKRKNSDAGQISKEDTSASKKDVSSSMESDKPKRKESDADSAPGSSSKKKKSNKRKNSGVEETNKTDLPATPEPERPKQKEPGADELTSSSTKKKKRKRANSEGSTEKPKRKDSDATADSIPPIVTAETKSSKKNKDPDGSKALSSMSVSTPVAEKGGKQKEMDDSIGQQQRPQTEPKKKKKKRKKGRKSV